MNEARVRAWQVMSGPQGEDQRVYQLFRDLLHHLPMSYTKLANRIGVSQPAVSRWAADVSRPSLGEMAAAFRAVSEEIEEVHRHLDPFGEVLHVAQVARRDLRVREAGPEAADVDAQ